jgi:hypothetical protein
MPMHHWNPFSKERKLERKDQIIGWLMFIGLIMLFGCGWGTLMLAFIVREGGIDSIFNIIKWAPVVGLLMYLSGLVYGIYSERTENTGTRKKIPNSRIIARYAITRDPLMVTNESEFEFLDRPKYYVKILSPKEGSIEYQCQPVVFYQCGEGMMGDAEVQGLWLGAFTPYLGTEQTHVGKSF